MLYLSWEIKYRMQLFSFIFHYLGCSVILKLNIYYKKMAKNEEHFNQMAKELIYGMESESESEIDSSIFDDNYDFLYNMQNYTHQCLDVYIPHL